MTRIVLLLVLTLTTVPTATDPARARALELLDILKTRDEPKIRAFIERSFSTEALKNESLDDRTATMFQTAMAIRGASFVGWEQTSDVQGKLTFRNELIDRLQTMVVKVGAAPPHSIEDWSQPRGVPSLDETVATDEQVAEKLKKFVERLARYEYLSGALLLMRNDRQVLSGAYGLAERNFEMRNQLNTRFQTASMTKMFTAVAIGQLAEQGKLSLDDPLSKFVRDAPGGDSIRIKNLLSHTAGLGDLFDGSDFFTKNPRKYRSMADYLQQDKISPPSTRPGARWSYSNLGYLYLGLVIEKASGNDYYDYIANHIFKPAGMSNSGFWDFDYPVRYMAYPYEFRFVRGTGGYRNMSYQTGMRGTSFGGAISTVEDMAKFASALRSGVLLKPATLITFTSPKPELNSPFYGYGFFFQQHRNATVTQWGAGGNGMGTCNQLTVLDGGATTWTFVILSNGGISNCRIVYDEATRLIVRRLSNKMEVTSTLRR
jgi:CubicO group peptidase (beta-lactamase class C family)